MEYILFILSSFVATRTYKLQRDIKSKTAIFDPTVDWYSKILVLVVVFVVLVYTCSTLNNNSDQKTFRPTFS